MIAEKLGLAEKIAPPEIDDRTDFWLELFSLAHRGRPASYGGPLPLPPLDVLDLVERLSMPARPDEAVAVITAMDNAWLDWRERRNSATKRKSQ